MSITPPQIAQLRLNLAQPVYYKCFRSKVVCQGHRVRGQGYT